MACSHACRLLSELCGDSRCHHILIEEGAAGLLVEQGAHIVRPALSYLCCKSC